jgi:hypothetical protein
VIYTTALVAKLLALADAPADALLDQVETISEKAARHMSVRLSQPVWHAR